MAVLVKWLTRWFVAPVCKGSIPLYSTVDEAFVWFRQKLFLLEQGTEMV